MPLSRREFDAGERKLEVALLELLRASQDLAFSVDDLLGGLALTSFYVEENDALLVLAALESQRKIDSKTIDGIVYFSYRRTFGFRPPNR